MRAPPTHQFLRVITPVQAEEATWQSLELGAAMAKELRAELRALFMTDANALAAAALPVTRAVSYQTGKVGSFDVLQLEAAYRATAARARDRVAELCRRESIQWSFEWTGHLDTEGASTPNTETEKLAAEGNDLLLLDARCLAVPSQALPILQLLARHPLIALWDRQAPKPNRVVLFSGGGHDALLVSAAMVHALGVNLEVYVYGPDADDRAAKSSAVKAFLASQSMTADIREMELEDQTLRRDVVRDRRNSLFVFDSPEIAKAVLG